MSPPRNEGGDGYVFLHRQLKDNPRFKKPAWLSVWVYLLLSATHKPYRMTFDGRDVILEPGQLLTGRRKIAEATGFNESTVRRCLAVMIRDQQIDQRSGVKASIITIRNWREYQASGQQVDQQAASERPAITPKADSELTSKGDAESPENTGATVQPAPTAASKLTSGGNPAPRFSATNKNTTTFTRTGKKARPPVTLGRDQIFK